MTRPASTNSPPAIKTEGERYAEGGGSPPFDWGTLVAQTVHPAKVAIVEALCWVGRPLSATELAAMLEEDSLDFDKIHYHARALVRLGTLEIAHSRQVRGARERCYYFPRDRASKLVTVSSFTGSR
jgi:hypothetical protein